MAVDGAIHDSPLTSQYLADVSGEAAGPSFHHQYSFCRDLATCLQLYTDLTGPPEQISLNAKSAHSATHRSEADIRPDTTCSIMAGESSKSKANGTGKLPALDLDGHNLPPSPAPSTPRNGRKYALMTELVYTESSDQYNASSVPIYQVRAAPRAGG